MPVTPLKTLSQYRPSCGSGSGLRGVLPGVRSWSRGTSACPAGEPVVTVTYLYRMSNVLGPVTSSGAPFELVGLAGEQVSAREIRPFSYVDAYGVGPHYTDEGHGAPVLLEPVPWFDTAPASITVTDDTTPVVGSFIEQGLLSVYGVLFGRSIWLLDRTAAAPEVTLAFGDVSVVRKSTWTRQCPDGYFQQIYRPEFFPVGVVERISVVCPLVPDPSSLNPFLTITTTPGIHEAFPGVEQVSDGSRFPLGAPVGNLLGGTYVEMDSGFTNCGPNAADIVPPLDDTGVCE